MLTTWCQVPLRVAKTASFSLGVANSRRTRSSSVANRGRTTVRRLASDFGVGFRYVPFPVSVLIVPDTPSPPLLPCRSVALEGGVGCRRGLGAVSRARVPHCVLNLRPILLFIL